MGSQKKDDLLSQGYTVFRVQDYVPGDNVVLDSAAKNIPAEFDVIGSSREEYAGGKKLVGHITLENNIFMVYLPPKDPNYYGKSQTHINGHPIGFTPSQKGAEEEFKLWLSSLH